MTHEDMAARELGQLREILLAPVEERNKERDEKILDFVEELGRSLTERINELESRIEALTVTAEEDRRAIVENVADAIGALGQQLRNSTGSQDPYGLNKSSGNRDAG